MPFTLTMPKLSPTMEEGTVVKWHIAEGDQVKEGDLLLEAATDKATVEHNALDAGYVRKILIPEGESAIVNQPIAVFTETADESIEGYEPEGEQPPRVKEVLEEKKADELGSLAPFKADAQGPIKGPIRGMEQPVFTPTPPLEGYKFSPGGPIEGHLLASPLARRLAAEQGVDLTSVKGSGPHGRILSRDLPTGQSQGLVSFGRRAFPKLAPGTYEEEPLTQMRKVVGKRLQESKTFIPHFYVTQEIDAKPLVDIRGQFKEGGLRVTVNDLIIRAVALALKKHPEINSGYNTVNESIIRFKTIDVAVAVSLPDGLITPIIRHADHKNLGEISSEVRMLVKKAREGSLLPEEFTGGSFTISNLGMFGVRDFIGVINPPQAAILAIGGVQDKAVVSEEKVVAGRTISVTLSADHRVLDGADSARFLSTLQKILENPALLSV